MVATFQRSSAKKNRWPGFTLLLRTQWSQQRPRATTDDDEPTEDVTDRLHGDDGAPMACVFAEVAAGLLLTAAMPTVDTARSGDHGVDGKASPEIKTWQRFGLHGDGDFRRGSAQKNGWPE
uniref:DUF834 domain-containing protein n=1 Tax=Oryza sativa subsp. japonica TaxID=39947 RepID=Q69KS9_ORYSJ|nr:hypothetical protein [Oryza sativa Japonica Group]BAD36480.1 hypothetical protein [Oryza sativa Japonica Group]